MNSAKSIIVVFVFLGVVYGVYQVVNKPPADDGSPILNESGERLVSQQHVEITEAEMEAEIFGGNNSNTNSNALNAQEQNGNDAYNLNFGDNDAPGTSDKSHDPIDNDFAPPEFTPAPKSQPNLTLESPQGFQNPSQSDFNPNAEIHLDVESPNQPDFTPPTADVVAPEQSLEYSDLPAETTTQAPQTQNASFGIAGNTSELKNEFTAKATENNPVTAGSNENSNHFVKNQFFTQANDGETRVANAANGVVPNQFFKSKPELSNVNTKASDTEDLQQLLPEMIQNPKTAEATDSSESNSEEFTKQLAASWKSALSLIDQGSYRKALQILSKYHGDPRLTAEEHDNLESWIDPLAGKVIYSTEHHVTHGHRVQAGETLQSIAERYQISRQLIYNINQINISNPNALQTGTTLKVVTGPFSAKLNPATNKLTIFLGDLYAGNFVATLGEQFTAEAGSYMVQAKSEIGRQYIAQNGSSITANDPANPYGKYHLDLGHGLSLHSSSQSGAVDDTRGCVSLSPVDAEDAFGILGVGSTITIVKE